MGAAAQDLTWVTRQNVSARRMWWFIADMIASAVYGSCTGSLVLRCLRMMSTCALFARACTPASVLLLNLIGLCCT